jgi:hypothetical protein
VVVQASEANTFCVAAPLGALSALPRARAANIVLDLYYLQQNKAFVAHFNPSERRK